jgi:hypothetical protein
VIPGGARGTQAPTAAELLSAWEQGRAAGPPERILLLLSLTAPGPELAGLGRITVGERNARLLRLREAAFGTRLEALVACPACQEGLEVELDAIEILATGGRRMGDPAGGAGRPARNGTPSDPLEVEMEGRRLRLRPPTLEDLHAVADRGTEAPAALLARCVTDPDGEPVSLPTALKDAVEAELAKADPLAELELGMDCPACGHGWTAGLDVPSYLWEEIEAWAVRTLEEVHLLASAYGWSEAEILGMTPVRRRAYLELGE